MTNHHQHSESGNAFWIILLAIALLVAITITVTRSSENTAETGNRDRNRIVASDILRQAKSVQQAVDQLRLRGVAENQVNFDTPALADYDSTLCGDPVANDDDDACKVFHRLGAGLTYRPPSESWLRAEDNGEDLFGEWYFYANACVPEVGTGAAGCDADDSATELIAVLPWLREDICVEINRLVGIENLSNPTRPPLLSGSAFTNPPTKFTGIFAADSEITTAGSSFTRRHSGCFEGAAASAPSGGFHFYHVLIPR